MKKSLLTLAAVAGLACSASAQVVISQVYGGGGNSGAPFNQDFVELHNTGTTAVTVPAGGWSVQYGSAAGNFGSSAATIIAIPENTMIPAGGYLLIGGATGANGSAIPTPDFSPAAAGNFNLSGTNGKVALITGASALGNANCGDARILDVVGYGSASCGEGTNVPVLSNTTAAVRNADGCVDTNNNFADFSVSAPSPRNSASAPVVCSGFVDCNNNGVADATDIANGTSQDCNTDGVPDECQLTGGDCNGNGQLDACEIAANPSIDCNTNGRIDSCEITDNPFLDSCNSNGTIDSCETPGPGEDCNNNGIIDCWDFKVALLTDVNNNGTPDACEGAAVVEAALNATVQPAGVRAGSNNDGFVNIEGSFLGNFASYAGIRWNMADIAAQLDVVHGAGQWQADKVYLYLQQSNAAFTLSSLTDAMQLYYTNNDAQDLSNGNTNTIYPNFATDFADRDLILNYTFTQGSGGPFGDGSGTVENYLTFDLAGSNNSAATSVAGEVNSGSGTLTLLINTTDDFAAATYAGRTNTSWRGPTIVVFGQPTGPTCDPDVNCDGVPDQGDVACMILAVAGDLGCFCQADPDFNRDGVPDQGDVADVILSVAGAPCP